MVVITASGDFEWRVVKVEGLNRNRFFSRRLVKVVVYGGEREDGVAGAGHRDCSRVWST